MLAARREVLTRGTVPPASPAGRDLQHALGALQTSPRTTSLGLRFAPSDCILQVTLKYHGIDQRCPRHSYVGVSMCAPFVREPARFGQAVKLPTCSQGCRLRGACQRGVKSDPVAYWCYVRVNRRLFSTTSRELADIPMAANQGGMAPAAASGTAQPL